MRHGLRTDQWVPLPVEAVFAFFADPANLPPLMPAWQRARLEELVLIPPPLAPGNVPRPFAAGIGSRLTISFRIVPYVPLRLPWDGVIVGFEWNRSFCDEQRPCGPFRYWRHQHMVFPETQDGIAGTRVADDLEYQLPWGMLGNIADKIFVRRQIEGVFAYRQKRLLQLLMAPAASRR